MTVASSGFSRAAAQFWVSHEVRRGAQGASLVLPEKSGLHGHEEGERVIALESWLGKRDSGRIEEGLSRSYSG